MPLSVGRLEEGMELVDCHVGVHLLDHYFLSYFSNVREVRYGTIILKIFTIKEDLFDEWKNNCHFELGWNC